MSLLEDDTVYELRRFRYENAPTGLGGAEPERGASTTDQELRDLLLFAASHAKGDPTLPRTVEALRVVWLVPVDVGTALFAEERKKS